MTDYLYRWYDAPNGRWSSRDPIEEAGGVNLYEFVGNDGVNGMDFFGLSAGDPYGSYAEAKAAAVEDLRKAGWESWKRGKDALNQYKDWSAITPQVHADWAVYAYHVRAGKAKWFIVGVEYFTLHYRDAKKDCKHYYTTIRRGRMPTQAEISNLEVGRLDPNEVEAAKADLPDGAKLEGLGHTHILQVFRSHHETGAITIIHNGGELSPGDKADAKNLEIEVYAIGFDGTIDPP